MKPHAMLIWLYVLVLLLGVNSGLFARSTRNSDNDSLKTQNAQKQFDFWVGRWNLEWGKDGKGTNTITKTMNDKVIMENFDGTPSIGLKGLSVSVFVPVTGKWHQTWVDNQGSYLDFTGGFQDGKMILERKANLKGKEIMQRMVYYNISGDKFEWNWERSLDDGKTWQIMWNIHYSRKSR